MTSPNPRTYGQWWDTPGARTQLSIDDTRSSGIAALMAVGCDEAGAAFITDLCLDKALQGDHARGVTLLLDTIRSARSGAIDLGAKVTIVTESPGTALVTGGARASGDLVCKAAMDLAIDKARVTGIGLVSARAQCRILTPHLMQAIDAGMVGLALVQSVPTVAPLGGFQPVLGNAPVGVGIPAGDRPAFILDMSLTQSSNKGVATAAEHGLPVPAGVLLDDTGAPTTDARDYLDAEESARVGRIVPKGSLVPLGDNHKGYALVLAVGLLSTLLADASPPWDLHYNLAERGQSSAIMIAIDPAAVRGPDAAPSGAVVSSFLGAVVSAPRRSGVDEILYPGLRSSQIQQGSRDRGVIDVPSVDAEAFAAMVRELVR